MSAALDIQKVRITSIEINRIQSPQRRRIIFEAFTSSQAYFFQCRNTQNCSVSSILSTRRSVRFAMKRFGTTANVRRAPPPWRASSNTTRTPPHTKPLVRVLLKKITQAFVFGFFTFFFGSSIFSFRVRTSCDGF
jgi:hypothetical protein